MKIFTSIGLFFLMNLVIHFVIAPMIEEESLQFPLKMAESSVILSDGRKVEVILEMVSGEYYDKNSKHFSYGGGTYEDGNYHGQYQIRTVWEGEELFSDWITLLDERMNFNKAFKLNFDDYNGDGNVDFTLGQWGSSNGSIYYIFSIHNDGSVEKLPGSDCFIAERAFSIQLDKINDTSFRYQQYDNTEGAWYEVTKIWNKDMFEYSRKKLTE